MKFEFKLKIEQKENTSKSYHYATITVDGDTEAVLQLIELFRDQWDKEHMT